MKEIKLLKVVLKNFKGHKDLVIDFGKKITEIFGQNASGKTTIVDAIMWLLFGKDSLGASNFSIRPLDENGKMIDNVEISVDATFEVDGQEVVLGKMQKQKWVKKRGSETTEFQGNVNSYAIDTFPCKEKDFKEKVCELINEDIFKLVTNPTTFVSMDWKKQRDVLFSLITDVSDLDVANSNAEFNQFIDDLSKGISLDRMQLKAKNTMEELKKTQVELPVRIDELKNSITYVDLAEQELAKNALKEELSKLEAEELNCDTLSSEYQKKKDMLFKEKIALSDIEQSENQSLIKERQALENEIFKMSGELDTINRKIDGIVPQQESLTTCINNAEKQKEKLADDYKKVSAATIDENSLVCSLCGQELPEDKKEQIVAEFEQKVDIQKKELVRKGNELVTNIKEWKAKQISLDDDSEKLQSQSKKLRSEVKLLNEELAKLPESVDLSDNIKYQNKKKTIQLMEQEIVGLNSGSDVRSQIRAKKQNIQNQLLEIEKILASADNSKTEERIEELTTQQRMVGQQAADQERIIYLLEQFAKAKMDMISSKVNSKFKTVKWKLFDVQINGGINLCCECMIDGVPFADLNSGHKIVAGLDIISVLQQMNEVKAPIFIDNAESINDFNIPEMDCQLIKLSVSTDKELRVEEK